MGQTETSSPAKSGSVKRVLGIVGNILLWIFLVLAALITIMALSTTAKDSGGIPNIFGYSLVSVQSDSMKPKFVTGDLVVVKKLTSEQQQNLEVGDIVTFNADIMKSDGTPGQDGKTELNTHKIIKKDEDGGLVVYKTQGEANVLEDDVPVSAGNIVGKYQGHIDNGGKVMDFLRSQLGFMICIVVPLILFFIFKIYRLIVIIVSRRAVEVSAEKEDEIARRAVEAYKMQQTNGAENAAPAKVPESNTDKSGDDKSAQG